VSTVTSTAATVLGVKLLTDFVKDVFHQESEQPAQTQDAKDSLLKEFPSILKSLLQVWGGPSQGKVVRISNNLFNNCVQDFFTTSSVLQRADARRRSPQQVRYSRPNSPHIRSINSQFSKSNTDLDANLAN
jgi:hypothetical protein